MPWIRASIGIFLFISSVFVHSILWIIQLVGTTQPENEILAVHFCGRQCEVCYTEIVGAEISHTAISRQDDLILIISYKAKGLPEREKRLNPERAKKVSTMECDVYIHVAAPSFKVAYSGGNILKLHPEETKTTAVVLTPKSLGRKSIAVENNYFSVTVLGLFGLTYAQGKMISGIIGFFGFVLALPLFSLFLKRYRVISD